MLTLTVAAAPQPSSNRRSTRLLWLFAILASGVATLIFSDASNADHIRKASRFVEIDVLPSD